MASQDEGIGDDDNTQYCVIEGSVVTGFEECARGEAKEKFGTDVTAKRGKITWKVPIEKVKNVMKLGSIDNARVVLHSVPHFKFTDQDDSLARLQKMIPSMDWESGIQVWRKFYDFPHEIASVPDVIPTPEELVEIIIMKRLQPKADKTEKSKKGGKGKRKDKRKEKNKNDDKVGEKGCQNSHTGDKDCGGDVQIRAEIGGPDVKIEEPGFKEDKSTDNYKSNDLSSEKNKTTVLLAENDNEKNLSAEKDIAKDISAGNDKAKDISAENDKAKDISAEKDKAKDISAENDKAGIISVDNDVADNISIEVSDCSVKKDKNSIPSPKTVIIRKADPNRKQPDINITVLDHGLGENVFPLSSESKEDREVESMDISMDVDGSLSVSNVGQDLIDKNNSKTTDNDLKFSGTEKTDIVDTSKTKIDVIITDGSSVDPEPQLGQPEDANSPAVESVTTETNTEKSVPEDSSESTLSPVKVKKERDPTKPSFRVTCNRVGDGHKFDSGSAAACLGSAINRYFGWAVDLKNYDFEILLNIDNEEVTVAIALTKVSLHNRNLVAFGPTTLRSTIAYNMLRLCRIKNGDFICDPMCGTSAIPIESATNWTSCYHFGGDFHEKALERTVLNINHIQEKLAAEKKSSMKIDAVQWNIQHFPLKDKCVDVFVSDLPFGVRMGSRTNNRMLYPCLLAEMARTGRFGARACLLTEDKTSLIKAIQTLSSFWKRRLVLSVNIGGLNGFVFMLTRSAVSITRTDIDALLSARKPPSYTSEKRPSPAESDATAVISPADEVAPPVVPAACLDEVAAPVADVTACVADVSGVSLEEIASPDVATASSNEVAPPVDNAAVGSVNEVKVAAADPALTENEALEKINSLSIDS